MEVDDDFVFPWDTHKVAAGQGGEAAAGQASGTSAAGASGRGAVKKHRRSSILKPAPPLGMTSAASRSLESNALRDVNQQSPRRNGDVAAAAAAAKSAALKRRSSKRVSFSSSKMIKEFQTGSHTLTIWDRTYEEENSQAGSSSTNLTQANTAANAVAASSSSSQKPQPSTSHENKENSSAASHERLAPAPVTVELSPTKRQPMHIDIPEPSKTHQFLPSFDGGKDLLLPATELPPAAARFSCPNDDSLAEPTGPGVEGFLAMLSQVDKRTIHMNTSINPAVMSHQEHLHEEEEEESGRGHDLDKSLFHHDASVDLSSQEDVDIGQRVTRHEQTLIFNQTGAACGSGMDMTLAAGSDVQTKTTTTTTSRMDLTCASAGSLGHERTLVFNQTAVAGGSMDMTLAAGLDGQTSSVTKTTTTTSSHMDLTVVQGSLGTATEGGSDLHKTRLFDQTSSDMLEMTCAALSPAASATVAAAREKETSTAPAFSAADFLQFLSTKPVLDQSADLSVMSEASVLPAAENGNDLSMEITCAAKDVLAKQSVAMGARPFSPQTQPAAMDVTKAATGDVSLEVMGSANELSRKEEPLAADLELTCAQGPTAKEDVPQVAEKAAAKKMHQEELGNKTMVGDTSLEFTCAVPQLSNVNKLGSLAMSDDTSLEFTCAVPQMARKAPTKETHQPNEELGGMAKVGDISLEFTCAIPQLTAEAVAKEADLTNVEKLGSMAKSADASLEFTCTVPQLATKAVAKETQQPNEELGRTKVGDTSLEFTCAVPQLSTKTAAKETQQPNEELGRTKIGDTSLEFTCAVPQLSTKAAAKETLLTNVEKFGNMTTSGDTSLEFTCAVPQRSTNATTMEMQQPNEELGSSTNIGDTSLEFTCAVPQLTASSDIQICSTSGKEPACSVEHEDVAKLGNITKIGDTSLEFTCAVPILAAKPAGVETPLAETLTNISRSSELQSKEAELTDPDHAMELTCAVPKITSTTSSATSAEETPNVSVPKVTLEGKTLSLDSTGGRGDEQLQQSEAEPEAAPAPVPSSGGNSANSSMSEMTCTIPVNKLILANSSLMLSHRSRNSAIDDTEDDEVFLSNGEEERDEPRPDAQEAGKLSVARSGELRVNVETHEDEGDAMDTSEGTPDQHANESVRDDEVLKRTDQSLVKGELVPVPDQATPKVQASQIESSHESRKSSSHSMPEDVPMPEQPAVPLRPVSAFHFEQMNRQTLSSQVRGHGRWQLETLTDHKATYSFLRGSLLLDLSLGLPMPAEDLDAMHVSVQHRLVSGVSFRQPTPLMLFRSADPLAKLAQRLLLRHVTTQQLHQWLPNTKALSAGLAKIAEELVTPAADFMLRLEEIELKHGYFRVQDQTITVGFWAKKFISEPVEIFYVMVDLSTGLGVRPKVAVSLQPGVVVKKEVVERMAEEVTDLHWGFVEQLVEKIDEWCT